MQATLKKAIARYQSGNLAGAEKLFEKALRASPRNAEILNTLGIIATQLGSPDRAETHWREAITVEPRNPAYSVNLAILLHRQGRLEDATKTLINAIELAPEHADAHFHLGRAFTDQGRLADAIESYRRCITVDADHVDAYKNLGNLLAERGDLIEAEETLRQLVALAPRDPGALNNLGLVLQRQGKTQQAESFYHEALGLDSRAPHAHNNLGNLLRDKGDYEGALDQYRKAIAIEPRFEQAAENIRKVLRLQGRLDEMIADYRSALKNDPQNPDYHFALGVALLSQGEFAEGWSHYEYRLKFPRAQALARKYLGDTNTPGWTGESLAGKKIFVYPEQGFGDVIQFARYLPLLARQAGTVMFQPPLALEALFRDSDLAVEVIAPNTELATLEFDCHVALASLPHSIEMDAAMIPSPADFLVADARRSAAFKQQHLQSEALKIGLFWQGNTINVDDDRRSIPLTELLPILQIPGVALYSLQIGPGEEQLAAVPSEMEVTPLGPQLKDFADTAAVVDNLDLVITVDTAVAHLAATMGKRTWILLAAVTDWRWLLGTEESPWYPTARLYRQATPGDWQAPIESLGGDLKQLLLLRENKPQG